MLCAADVPDARREARTLLMHTLARDHAFLLTRADDMLDAHTLALYREQSKRRATGEPLQYITERQEFYGLDFEVTPAVLIPRPETELLVETALELLRETPAPLVCDVGTGSGCIAVALMHERQDALALALDISPAALAVAARNAARHEVDERVQFLVSDCFAALDSATDACAMIVSNPPYIAARDMAGLQREVRHHEPRLALTPGGGVDDDDNDGLSIIRRLIADAPRYLRLGGHLLLEIGHDQHAAVAALVDPRVWEMLDTRRDLQGIPRTVVLRRKQ